MNLEDIELSIYDTETTGLPLKKASRTDSRQPHIVQLACLITDGLGNEKRSMNRIIKPQGYTEMDPKAQESHGISFERAMDEGLPRREVLEEFLSMIKPSKVMVAHNKWFDLQLLDFAFIREFRGSSLVVKSKSQFCTMEAYTPIIKLPPTEKMLKYGFGPYKNASLTECHVFCFGEEFEGAHDAMADVRAVKRILFKLPSSAWLPASSGQTQ